MRLSNPTSGKLIDMRHEEKYICSDKQLLLLEHRLKNFLPVDSNQKEDDYLIRSLYLDTMEDKFYHESLNGVYKRSKYRIRFYDLNSDFLRLERKDTIGALKSKTSQVCTKDWVDSYLETGKLADDEHPLLKELHILNRAEGLRPIAVIDYSRKAFVYETGNIRITFDRNISCSHNVAGVFDKNLVLTPVMPYGKHVLEVKYDGILPGYIARIVESACLERVSFSKYAYARNVIENNGRREEGYEY